MRLGNIFRRLHQVSTQYLQVSVAHRLLEADIIPFVMKLLYTLQYDRRQDPKVCMVF